MPTAAQIQALVDKRAAAVRAASEQRDVDALMSFHSKDATFVNSAQNLTIKGWDALHQFYAQSYAAMPTFTTRTERLTGLTPEFIAWEGTCEGIAAIDVPGWGLKAGDTLKLHGVSLFWWAWEGEGEWDGSTSDAAMKGWKIVEEHAHYQPV